MALTLHRIGPGASLQDRGRIGWQRYGVSVSGPMDWLAAQLANHMVGNDDTAALLEVDQAGLTAQAAADCLIGMCAPKGAASLNGDDILPNTRLALRTGDQISLAPAKQGGWAYLAIAGGFAGNRQLGSVAYHRRSALGGPALSAGMTLHTDPAAISQTAPASFPLIDNLYADTAPLRLILGPQDGMITSQSRQQFCDGGFRLSLQCDRMGYRLTGDAMQHVDGADIVSDGIAMGTIQVPGDGQPIILMADRQTSGGYPKLGTIITADLPRLAQHPIGSQSFPLRFMPVSGADAIAALRAVQKRAKSALSAPHPVGPRTPTTDILLRANLIDGAVADK